MSLILHVSIYDFGARKVSSYECSAANSQLRLAPCSCTILMTLQALSTTGQLAGDENAAELGAGTLVDDLPCQTSGAVHAWHGRCAETLFHCCFIARIE